MNTRKKGILFFAVVAGIMLTSAVTLAVNPAQWIDDNREPVSIEEALSQKILRKSKKLQDLIMKL